MKDDMNPPPDSRARETALDITRSHHVEAPAGSGKTMLLVTRFIKLLGCVRHPHEILALTFTNKAAGEMKTRIGTLLQKANSGLPPANNLEASLLESARKALERHDSKRFLLLSPEGLQVTTFHGFCYALVRRAPLEAGVPPESMVIDEEERETLLNESIRKMIRDVVSLPEGAPERVAFENRLLRLNNNLPALVEEISDLVKRRDLFSDLVEALGAYANLDEFGAVLTRRMGRVVEGFLRVASESFGTTSLCSDWAGFHHHLKEAGAPNADTLPENVPGIAWEDLTAWKVVAEALTTKSGKPRRKTGPATGGFYKGFSKGPWGEQVRALQVEATRILCDLKDLPEPEVSLTDMDALSDLIILVAQAISTYETRCRQQHVLDFAGLEQAALRTLAEDVPSDLQLLLDHRIQQILVDEFQDTSRSQWILLQRLCAGWTPGDGRTLFLVGDPKQSVYAFRKAEVRLFLEAKKGVPISGQGLLPVTNIQLEANFRTQAPLVEWTNRFFSRTGMANPKDAFDEVPFQLSTAHPSLLSRYDTDGSPVSLSLFFKEGAISSPAEAEAEWLARAVQNVAERSPGASIGILLFTRNRLSLYLNALRRIGQALRVKEGLRVAEQPEVVHLYQIARALCRPHDDLAWASLARSPWSWVSSTLLLEIARMSPAAWSQKFRLGVGKHPEVARIQEAMELGRRRVGRDPLAEVVRTVWAALDGPSSVAARFGAEGVGNCRLFLEILESVDAGIPEETLLRLDSVLETVYAPEAPDTAGAPVDLMTVHAAKGLEFDAVFLPYLDRHPLAGSLPPPYLLERSSEPPGRPLIAMGPDRRLGEPEAGYPLLKRLADGRRLGEAKRILYVGITRARKQLFLSGIAKHSDRGPIPPKDSYLDLILTDTTENDETLISVFHNPVGPGVTRKTSKELKPLPHPVPFHVQPLPYVMETPSELVDTFEHEWNAREDETEVVEHAAIGGTITHRLIQTLWHDGTIPETQRIATALASEGMDPDAAISLAKQIADDLTACRKEPLFQWLLDQASPGGKSEYAIEAIKQEGVIQTGILDFVRQDEDRWWIVDFKTSRPTAEQDEAEFVKAKAARYRPQLLAYQGMLAKAQQVDISQIIVGLYFTALQKWHRIT